MSESIDDVGDLFKEICRFCFANKRPFLKMYGQPFCSDQCANNFMNSAKVPKPKSMAELHESMIAAAEASAPTKSPSYAEQTLVQIETVLDYLNDPKEKHGFLMGSLIWHRLELERLRGNA